MPDFGDFSFPSAPGLTREQLLAWYADHPSIDSPGTGAFTPPNPPQAIPGALPGVLSSMGAGGAQGAPAGDFGAPQRPRIGVPPSGNIGVLSQGLGPAQGWPNAPPLPGADRFTPPSPAAVPALANTQQAMMPPPQAAAGQPQQAPAIPPASAAGRTQQQGNPLDQYFQQMMALQRQRMLLGMAGGLLGAPSFGQGLGRAFTNASESMAPQTDLVSKIAGAQAAYQNTIGSGGSPKEAANAAMANLMGAGGEYWKSVLNPEFKSTKYMGRDINFVNRGGVMVHPQTGFRPWVFGHMGKDAQGNNVPVDQAQPFTDKNGRKVIILDDGRKVDPTAEEPQ